MPSFKLDHLDHVAVRAKNMEVSAVWYEKVLGLKRVQPPEWKPFPIFMISGTFGVAIFPANTDHPKLDPKSRNVKIDHFAFNVSRDDFKKAEAHYQALGLDYNIQDHHYFHSMYTKDPDGHTVELTTQVRPDWDSFKTP